MKKSVTEQNIESDTALSKKSPLFNHFSIRLFNTAELKSFSDNTDKSLYVLLNIIKKLKYT